MSLWSFIVTAALSVGSEVVRALFYLGLLFAVVNMLVYAACQIIDKIYDRKITVHETLRACEDDPAAEAPPLHIV